MMWYSFMEICYDPWYILSISAGIVDTTFPVRPWSQAFSLPCSWCDVFFLCCWKVSRRCYSVQNDGVWRLMLECHCVTFCMQRENSWCIHYIWLPFWVLEAIATLPFPRRLISAQAAGRYIGLLIWKFHTVPSCNSVLEGWAHFYYSILFSMCVNVVKLTCRIWWHYYSDIIINENWYRHSMKHWYSLFCDKCIPFWYDIRALGEWCWYYLWWRALHWYTVLIWCRALWWPFCDLVFPVTIANYFDPITHRRLQYIRYDDVHSDTVTVVHLKVHLLWNWCILPVLVTNVWYSDVIYLCYSIRLKLMI